MYPKREVVQYIHCEDNLGEKSQYPFLTRSVIIGR